MTVPLMPCASVEDALAFYEALGFEATYKQSRPYVYLALQWSGFQLHFGPAPKGLDPAREESGGCLVMVDAVAPYHAEFVAAMLPGVREGAEDRPTANHPLPARRVPVHADRSVRKLDHLHPARRAG